MDTAQRLLIREKLAAMESQLQELKEMLPATLKDYLVQRPHRRAVERLAQIVVESATDSSRLIIEGKGLLPPASARESFQMARTLDVIDGKLLQRFHRYVTMRNYLVHNYDNLDDALIWKDARRLVVDAAVYIRQARAYLAREEAKQPRRQR